jgi:hypothetical protein
VPNSTYALPPWTVPFCTYCETCTSALAGADCSLTSTSITWARMLASIRALIPATERWIPA